MFFAQISPNLPEKEPQENDLQYLQKNVCICFGDHVSNQSTSSVCAEIFTLFSEISTDFAQIFTKSKLLGVRLHPLHSRPLHHWSVETQG